MRFALITEIVRDPMSFVPFVALAAYFLGRLWFRRAIQGTDALARAIADFKACGVAVAVLVVSLMFSLSTPVLGSFGVPRSAEQMSDPAEVFRLLRMYNAELVAASYGLQWCAMFLGLALVSSLRVMRELEARLSVNPVDGGGNTASAQVGGRA